MITTFPNITHISQVLPAIEGRTEFSYWQTNEHFDLVAYYLLASDTFKSDDPKIVAMRRECRGLLFHKDGTVARRAFHKFFNVGETEETMPQTLDLSKSHMVLEKLDGSMVAPFISQINEKVYWASMRGSKDYHERLSLIYDGSPHENLVRIAHEEGLTAIMEFCSADNRIVVEYAEPQMTLLALRNRITGEYSPRSKIEQIAAQCNVPLVQPMPYNENNISKLMEKIDIVEGIEGAVIWFEDGRLAKLKGEWYQQLHKLLASFDFEKDVARLILSNNQDDLMGILSPTRKKRLIEYQDSLLSGIKSIVKSCEETRDKIISEGLSRKDFAMSEIAKSSIIKATMFKHFDSLEETNFAPTIIASALAQTNSQGKWETFKNTLNLNLKWVPDTE